MIESFLKSFIFARNNMFYERIKNHTYNPNLSYPYKL